MNIYPTLTVQRWTLSQAAEMARVNPRNVYNWRSRGAVTLGERHWTGAITFSTLDVMRLALIQAVVSHTALAVEDAATIAETLVSSILGTAFPVDVLLIARGDDGRVEMGSLDDPSDNPRGLRRRTHTRLFVAEIVDAVAARAGLAAPSIRPPNHLANQEQT